MPEPTIYETHYPHSGSGARIAELESEIESLRLTDAERDVLAWLASAGDETRPTTKTMTLVMRATIQGLLKRLK